MTIISSIEFIFLAVACVIAGYILLGVWVYRDATAHGANALMWVLLVLLVESMFVYNFGRSYYNSVQQTMMRRFSSINGQLKMYTGDTAQKTAANRSVALRRMWSSLRIKTNMSSCCWTVTAA